MADALDDMAAFNESLARVMELARASEGEAGARSAYERAWCTFWTEHFDAFMHHARGVARRKLPAELVDVFESDLLAEVIRKITREGQELNRQILAGIRDNIIRRIHDRISKERDDDRLEHKLAELLGTGRFDEARHAELQRELAVVIESVDGPRSDLRSRVIRAILDGPDGAGDGEQPDAVFKKNGTISLAGVARYLDVPEGTVRRTLAELRAEIPSRWPHLAEFLDIRDHLDEREFELQGAERQTGDAS